MSVVNSRKTIICFSPDYIESSWKQYEALMAHYMDPMGHNGIFIPIVLEGKIISLFGKAASLA